VSGRWKCSIFLDSRFFCFTTWRFLVSSSTIITLPSIQYNHQVLYAILDVSKILFQRIGHWKKAPSKSTASTSAENHINTSIFCIFHQACFPSIGEVSNWMAHSPPSFVHKIKAKITLFVKRRWFELSQQNLYRCYLFIYAWMLLLATLI